MISLMKRVELVRKNGGGGGTWKRGLGRLKMVWELTGRLTGCGFFLYKNGIGLGLVAWGWVCGNSWIR